MIPPKDAQHPDGPIAALLQNNDLMMGSVFGRQRADRIVGRAAADALRGLNLTMQLNHMSKAPQLESQ